jgi:hypothetical protein
MTRSCCALNATEPILEFDQSSHPFRTDLTDLGLAHKDGWGDDSAEARVGD